MTPLRLLRESREIPAARIAQAVGVDLSHFYKVERAEASASKELAKRISVFFEGAITPAEILYPEDYPVAAAATSGEAA